MSAEPMTDRLAASVTSSCTAPPPSPPSFAKVACRMVLPPDLGAVVRTVTVPLRERLLVIAPPGSGKTLLGEALICRYAAPCLLLTPDETGRELWLSRWREDFLPEDAGDGYVSRSPDVPALLTVLTYREAVETCGGRGPLVALRAHGVKTLLLDEPYRLPASVQAVAERLTEGISGMRVIGLSSLPPFDGDEEARARLAALCGDVRAEVSVPTLVRQGILCPHRDLLYLCEPSETERRGLDDARRTVAKALGEILRLPFLADLGERLCRAGRGYLYRRRDEALALCELLVALSPLPAERRHAARVGRLLTGSSAMAPLTARRAKTALSFLLDSHALLSDGEKERLAEALRMGGVAVHGEAWETERVENRRRLTHSLGKCIGIRRIVETESRVLKEALRLLVYLPSTPLDQHTSNDELCHARAVWEDLSADGTVPTGAWLDGRLYLPLGMEVAIHGLCGVEAVAEIAATDPDRAGFGAPYRFATPADEVFVLERLFEQGMIRLLVTDAALPGGGWVERLANTLVLPLTSAASGDGAYTGLRLRGELLRTRRDSEREAVHIWHMATLTPTPEGREVLARTPSEDVAAVTAAFDCLVGPDETAPIPQLVSGLDRLGMAVPESDPRAWNRAMEGLAQERRGTADIWQVASAPRPRRPGEPPAAKRECRIMPEAILPHTAGLPAVTVGSVCGLLFSLLCILGGGYAAVYLSLLVKQASGLPAMLGIMIGLLVLDVALLAWGLIYTGHRLPFLWHHRTRRASVRSVSRALLRAMQALGLVRDEAEAIVTRKASRKAGQPVFRVSLRNVSRVEAERFTRALCEMLTPPTSPRYLIARRGLRLRPLWRFSFACPAEMAVSDNAVRVLAGCMDRSLGRVEIIYTRHEHGRRALGATASRGYVTKRRVRCRRRMRVE